MELKLSPAALVSPCREWYTPGFRFTTKTEKEKTAFVEERDHAG